ncbi:glutathione transferase [Hypoxylon fragiforme]|uniref:glutathione transferase n=1 Tax=Hypoxylon fragiforme TaxID=63214 RepID=UPI0020C63FF0|nr:glutathione transferase [Hypoxylon fragiforme]KAI2605944.1 glutathione transferase [Hypoxylon fragiforme]
MHRAQHSALVIATYLVIQFRYHFFIRIMQPFKVYNGPHGQGPNPWKVLIVLEELGLPWEIVWIPYGEIKSEPYTSLNPNGKLPAFIDPNNNQPEGITLFETGAIINYLIATYDTELKLTYGDGRVQEKWLLQSWLMLQMSGQGPMFGQKMWFTHVHKERNLESVLERYGSEVKRIMGVVSGTLRKQREKLGGEGAEDAEVWLVGDKCTYADLAFAAWNPLLVTLFPELPADWVEKEFPEYYRWNASMLRREGTRKVLEYREECIRTMRDTGIQVVQRQKDAGQIPEYRQSMGVGKS